LIVAFVGLGLSKPRRLLFHAWMPIVIAVLALLLRGQPVKLSGNAIYETESAYNYIQVVEEADGCRLMLLNEGAAFHSIYCPDRLYTGGPWDYFLVAPYFSPAPHTPAQVERVALIGLAGGTMARQFTEVYGPLPIDGIEIDPETVRVGRDYFEMNQPNLDVTIADGRYALARSDRRYSVVGLDAYRLPYIPPHLTTVEFFREVREHLTDDGVLAINVGRAADDYRIVEALMATLLEVYPSVHVIEVSNSLNAVVVATVQPSTPENLAANLPNLEEDTFLYATALHAMANMRPTQPGETVFTDDRAAIELMTNALVIDFFLSGIQ
jgi:spermidine synthase